VNERSFLSIGEVLALLQDEFPDVTISKIRFLESQGLIGPERTPSGYRKFYDGDVERLRFILREQKEHFLPLRVIKDRLENGAPEAAPNGAAVPREGLPVAEPAAREPAWMAQAQPAPASASASDPPGEATVAEDPAGNNLGGRLTADQLCATTGLSRRDLAEVERYGLLTGQPAAGVTYYDHDAVACARVVATFLARGLEPRHLRLYRNAADREAALFEQVVLPLVKQRNPQARATAVDALVELARNGAELRAALLKQALRPYLEPS
jgi:DNA-binding transcriptional MerR regulator